MIVCNLNSFISNKVTGVFVELDRGRSHISLDNDNQFSNPGTLSFVFYTTFPHQFSLYRQFPPLNFLNFITHTVNVQLYFFSQVPFPFIQFIFKGPKCSVSLLGKRAKVVLQLVVLEGPQESRRCRVVTLKESLPFSLSHHKGVALTDLLPFYF